MAKMIAAERRAGDDADLRGDAPERDRSGEQLGRDDLRGERARRRAADRGRDAGDRPDGEERPQDVHAADGDREQHADGGEVEHERDGGDRPARDAVGDLAGRERQDRQRHELGEAHETEVERVAVDGVDLPPDCDRDHLRREAVRERRRPQERERPVL